ncbi:PilZ domain-containing protein [Acanthopleuribacter pedis]|uniref:PilZ domain-containing protein n=1 Tax=Acanthopleuribacter pedis TaxID=442870 RepID=A0A8J7QDY0_9BACT|nr:PilZ domain-containing protein [Acanthopleuribacter pedis]MBO1322054.1 PilZ domain-containing protein [Acanthopleuribacter pedis]
MSLDAITADELLTKIEARVADDAKALTCLLINTRRQCHDLEPVSVDKEAALVAFRAPGGRVAPLDPDCGWDLVIQAPKTAYRIPVAALAVDARRVRCTLPLEGEVLARRQCERFSASSRNPVQVSIVCRGEACQASLVDFSAVGIGIQQNACCGLNVGDVVEDGVFALRGVPVHFTRAHVAHQKVVDGGIRLGLAFSDLSASDQESITQALVACARARSYVSSMRADG